MSTCCGAPVVIKEKGVVCFSCKKPCKINFDAEHVIKIKEGKLFLIHFRCEKSLDGNSVTSNQEDVLSLKCDKCGKFLK